ncbi:uncharacterized protein [Lepeophtheirus salmonis]|uniref:uncharacterized protein isoform X1 n=1 Tax=Lepeophtheirus salmonis TaxID=72036 RepID=UPI003AF3B7B1
MQISLRDIWNQLDHNLLIYRIEFVPFAISRHRRRTTQLLENEEDDVSNQKWKTLINKRKKSKYHIQKIRNELDSATRALVDIDKRRNERSYLFKTPSPPILKKVLSPHEPVRQGHSNCTYLSTQPIRQQTQYASLIYTHETESRLDRNPCPYNILPNNSERIKPSIVHFPLLKIGSIVIKSCIRESLSHFLFNNDSCHNLKKKAIVHIVEADLETYISYCPLVLGILSQFSKIHFSNLLSRAICTKEESNLLTIVYHWTEVFFCINAVVSSKNDLVHKNAIKETHLSGDVHSFDLISSDCPFEIVNDSGVDDDDWEYYSEYEEESIKKEPSFPKIPVSLLERWNTSIWASDDDESESDYYSSEEEDTDDYEEFDLTDDRLLRWIRDLNQENDSKFLKNLTANREKPLKFRKITKSQNVTEYVYDPKGIQLGYYRDFINGGFTSFGKCITKMDSENKPRPFKHETIWLKLLGNTYCFFGSQKSFYLYPDLTTAIIGNFDFSGKLKDFGIYGRVSSLEKINELLIPNVTPIEGLQKISFDPASSIVISQNPMLRDPYECSTVVVSQSKIPYAGEGLYAKRNVRPNTLLALFNGIKRREVTGQRTHWSLTTSDYGIALKRDMTLDIPPGNESLKKYCATIGHKCCHSFTPNSAFEEIYHPRFGHIMSVISVQDIRVGEEITVSYNYDLARSPVWYRDAWFHYLRDHEDLNETTLQMTANKKSKVWGLVVTVPPPSKTSPKFVPCGICKEHVGMKSWAIRCKKCETWNHFSCVDGLNTEIFEKASKSEEELDWKCSNC